jgi:hypothetical protein
MSSGTSAAVTVMTAQSGGVFSTISKNAPTGAPGVLWTIVLPFLAAVSGRAAVNVSAGTQLASSITTRSQLCRGCRGPILAG